MFNGSKQLSEMTYTDNYDYVSRDYMTSEAKMIPLDDTREFKFDDQTINEFKISKQDLYTGIKHRYDHVLSNKSYPQKDI